MSRPPNENSRNAFKEQLRAGAAIAVAAKAERERRFVPSWAKDPRLLPKRPPGQGMSGGGK